MILTLLKHRAFDSSEVDTIDIPIQDRDYIQLLRIRGQRSHCRDNWYSYLIV
jgi:hypothetical protein